MRTPTVLRQPSELAGSSALRRISHSPNDKDVETVSRRFLKCVDWHVVRLRLRAVEVECKSVGAHAGLNWAAQPAHAGCRASRLLVQTPHRKNKIEGG